MKKILLILLTITMFSCTEKEDDTNSSITGFVNLYGLNRSQINDRSNVTIKVYKDENIISTQKTNSNGGFSIKGMPLGKLILTFSKDNFSGCDSIEYMNSDVSTSLLNITLFQVPPVTVQLYPITFDENFVYINNELNVSGSCSSSLELFYGLTPSVSYKNYKYRTFDGGVLTCNNPGTITGSQGSMPQYWYDAGFKKGDRIYLIMYPVNADFPEQYDNINNNLNVLAHVRKNPSNIISFILP